MLVHHHRHSWNSEIDRAPAAVSGADRKPALLITDSYSATLPNVSRPKRDKEVLSLIVETMRADGNVLIPIDAAGRIFDLILLLEQHWTQNRLSTYQLVVFSPVAKMTIELAKSQLEWMNADIMKRFESARDNPFWLKNFKLCQSVQVSRSCSIERMKKQKKGGEGRTKTCV